MVGQLPSGDGELGIRFHFQRSGAAIVVLLRRSTIDLFF
jgi:hypothetical protein